MGEESFKLGNLWDGVTSPAVQEEFRSCNAYSRPECADCWARLYCSGGCAANAYHVDNEIAVQNLTRMASGFHLSAKAEKVADAHFVVTAEVSEPVTSAVAEEPELVCTPDARGNTVVAVDTNIMLRPLWWRREH